MKKDDLMTLKSDQFQYDYFEELVRTILPATEWAVFGIKEVE